MKLRYFALCWLAFTAMLVQPCVAVLYWGSFTRSPGTQPFTIDAWDQFEEDDWREITLYKNGVYLASETAYADWVYISKTTTAGFHTEFAAGDEYHYITVIVNLDTQPPTVPTGLTASNKTATSFTLSWTASSDNWAVSGYEVKRDSTSHGLDQATSRSLSGLQPSIAYQLSVRARDLVGNLSGWSTPLTVTLVDTTPPTAPANLASSGHTATSIQLTWSPSTDDVGVLGYNIFRTKDGVSNMLPLLVNGTTFSDTQVLPSTSYSYSIKATDAAGNISTSSNSVTVTTAAVADADFDGIPDGLETVFGIQSNPNPTNDSALTLKTHRPLQ